METSIDLSQILTYAALCIAVIALALAIWTLLKVCKGAKEAIKQSSKVDVLNEKIDEIEVGLEKSCKKIVAEAIANAKVEAAKVEEPKVEAAPAPVEEPKAPVYVPEHFYGEYFEMDHGFPKDCLYPDRRTKVQAEITTISAEAAEFSILSDLDPVLVPGIQSCCEVLHGDWQDFNSISTDRPGTLVLKGETWTVQDKAKVTLVK